MKIPVITFVENRHNELWKFTMLFYLDAALRLSVDKTQYGLLKW